MTAPPNAAAPGSNTDLVELYRGMRRVRTFEERVGELFVRGQSAGSMLHLSIGEESAAVGFVSLMRDGDVEVRIVAGDGADDCSPDDCAAFATGRCDFFGVFRMKLRDR